jgi:hypothetical protein
MPPERASRKWVGRPLLQNFGLYNPTLRPLGTDGHSPFFTSLANCLCRRIGKNHNFVRVLDIAINPVDDYQVLPVHCRQNSVSWFS